MLFRAAALCLGLGLGGCLLPPSAAERVTDAARELNLAARFGRMDLALGKTSPDARQTFLEHHRAWGRTLRVLDVELVGLDFIDSGQEALVEVDVAWTWVGDAVLHSTRLTQVWHREDGGWRMLREQRSGGELGLFGEAVDTSRPPPRDVHFATKVLGSSETTDPVQ
jgi:hypothetical protein